MSENAKLLLQGFEVHHKLEKALGDGKFISKEDVAKQLTPGEQEALLAAKRQYWADGQIGLGYLKDLQKQDPSLDFDVLKKDPKTLPFKPQELEKTLSTSDIEKLNKKLDVKGEVISEETRRAVKKDKQDNWVDLAYTGSVKASLNQAEKEQEKALKQQVAKDIGLDKNSNNAISGEEIERFVNRTKTDIYKAQHGKTEEDRAAAKARLSKLDMDGDGDVDKKDIDAIKKLGGGAYDKLRLDQITKALGGKTFQVSDTQGPDAAPLTNLAQRNLAAGKNVL